MLNVVFASRRMILLLDWDSDKLRAHFLFRDVSMPFSKLGLSAPITDAVTALGYEKPTSIQQKAIPIVLRGSNLIAAAQTGTGKTASFVLPILEKLSQGETQRKKRARAIILTPRANWLCKCIKVLKRTGRTCHCAQWRCLVAWNMRRRSKR